MVGNFQTWSTSLKSNDISVFRYICYENNSYMVLCFDYRGYKIEAAEFSHLNFEYSLSDTNNIVHGGVGGPLSESTVLSSASKTALSGMQVDGANYMVQGTTEIEVLNYGFVVLSNAQPKTFL